MSASFKACVIAVVFSGMSWLCNASSPSWQNPSRTGEHELSKDFTVSGACNDLTELYAASTDRASVDYEVAEQVPNGGFQAYYKSSKYTYFLKCDPDTFQATTISTFRVVVRATSTDSGSSSAITINIINTGAAASNDFDPTFTDGTAQTKEVARDAFENNDNLLWVVTVSDADDNEITLSISDTDFFTLNGNNIEIISSLSALNSTHELEIVATDDGEPQRSATFTLTLILIHRPVFTHPVNNDVIYMCETDFEGDELVTLEASDEDDGDVDQLTFHLTMVDSQYNGLFNITNKVLMVHAGVQQGEFDVEDQNNPIEFEIRLTVSDNTLSSTINVTVQVEDFNDNEPEFSGTKPLTVHILDSILAGADVYQVTITDDDITDDNRNFKYEISGSDKFVIDDGGKITLNDAPGQPPLNFEDEYTLTITVNDTDDPDTTFTVDETLTIIIDTAPEFNKLDDAQNMNVSESAAVGTVVFTFDVQDKDELPNPLQITILSESQPNVFEVNGTTLVTKSELDMEDVQSYSLTFQCSDGSYTTNSKTLTIDVLDENDYTPIITEIPDVTIPENLAIGDNVVAVTVTDGDWSSPNKDVTWEIESGNDDGYFQANVATGYITLAAQPVSTTTDNYTLVISARDDGNPAKSSTLGVTIIINSAIIDECENDPCDQSTSCDAYVNDFICTCSAGYKGKICDTKCSDNKFGLNCAQNCICPASRVAEDAQDQTCDPVDGTCICNNFWTGDDCETDVDECTTPNICNAAEHRTCNNTDGSYDCICISGYREIDDTCQEDECLLDPCSNGGTCVDTIDGFTCECTPGWQINTNCTAECAGNTYGQDCADNCSCTASHVAEDAQDQTCEPVDGTCICNNFWTGDDCETDVDECTTPNICNAAEHRTCNNTDGSYDCICISGYREIDDTCQEDECLLDPCSNGGTCVDTIDGFTCECTPGWQINTNCTAECAGNTYGQDCADNCNCTASHVAEDAQDQTCEPVDGTCICNNFWTGDDCETDVDECNITNICDEAAQRICENGVGNYSCVCEQGYIEDNNVCNPVTVDNIQPGQFLVELTLPGEDCPNLKKPSVYKELKRKLEEALTKKFNRTVIVYNIKCGSIEFKSVILSNNTFEERVKLVEDINALKESGSLEYDDRTVPMAVKKTGFTNADGNSSSVLPVLDICDNSVCYRCETSNAAFKCRIIDDDNQALIWALCGFALSTIFIGSMIVLVVICYKKRQDNINITRHKRHDQMSRPKKPQYNSDRSFNHSQWYDQYKSDKVPHIAHSESLADPYQVSPYSAYNGRGSWREYSF